MATKHPRNLPLFLQPRSPPCPRFSLDQHQPDAGPLLRNTPQFRVSKYLLLRRGRARYQWRGVPSSVSLGLYISSIAEDLIKSNTYHRTYDDHASTREPSFNLAGKYGTTKHPRWFALFWPNNHIEHYRYMRSLPKNLCSVRAAHQQGRRSSRIASRYNRVWPLPPQPCRGSRSELRCFSLSISLLLRDNVWVSPLVLNGAEQ